MGLFTRNAGYDRKQILAAAEGARAKGRRHKAIALYRRVLVVEADNPELHARIAPLLAQTGQTFDAWKSFKLAARHLMRGSRWEPALAQFREAARLMPHEIEAWQAIAEVQRQQGRDRDARTTLLEGRRKFRSRGRRPEAIDLLRRAREIETWDPEIVLDLARLLGKTRQRAEGRALLEELAERCEDHELRRVRAALWRLDRTVKNSWLWVRAMIETPGESGRPVSRPSSPVQG